MNSSASVLHMIRGVAPLLNEAEKHALNGWWLSFEYPDYALLPANKAAREALERQYWQEQIDVWAIVLPKVLFGLRREREALRRAVSGIMGRNMSHNIGSHVLARYRAAVEGMHPFNFLSQTGPLSKFLFYLQQRMDFLADVATSDQAFRFQTLSLQEQINQLNYDELCQSLSLDVQMSIEPDVQMSIEPVHLRYITGKEGLKSTVKYASEQDVQFACPGGEVGVHALFIILENIIRNSARHNDGNGCMVELLVSVDNNTDGELLKVEIVDQRSLAKGTELVGKLNKIIGEPLLESNGEAKPNNWGIREMQICAHFLRGLSLYDLERKPEGGVSVLKAECDKSTGNLKYTMHLLRAKRMAAVVSCAGKTKEEKKALKRHGILLLDEVDGAFRNDCLSNWKTIGICTRGYEFLVVESNPLSVAAVDGQLKTCTASARERAEAALPVRVLSMSRNEIHKLISEAGKGNSSWMDLLHERYAKLVRDDERRGVWKTKPLYGVIISRNQALKSKPDPCWPACIPADGGLIEACHPLTDEAKRWLKHHPSEGVAAAWVDHANADDFSGCWISVETARSGDAHARFLSNRPDPHSGWEILASAIPRVAVLDERVQSVAGQRSRVGEFDLSKIWHFMGVWVPPKRDDNGGSCDLDSPSFSKCQEFLNNPTSHCEQFPIDILVIHLTILEGLNRERNNGARIKETLATTLNCLVGCTQAADAEIVIVTGRGVPAVARAAGSDGASPSGVRYLPISALLESLVSQPSKLALMQTLWSAGRPSAANS